MIVVFLSNGFTTIPRYTLYGSLIGLLFPRERFFFHYLNHQVEYDTQWSELYDIIRWFEQYKTFESAKCASIIVYWSL